MVSLLSVLSSLETLSLRFQWPICRPGRESPSLHPPEHFILPSLRQFVFRGVVEYLEQVVTRIDTPQLDKMEINFINEIDFYCPRLGHFINRTPKLSECDEAHVQFDNTDAKVTLRPRTSKPIFYNLLIQITCFEQDRQLPFIEQVSNSFSYYLSTVEDLYIEHKYSWAAWKNDAVESTLWLELLHPFTAVKDLYLSKEFAPGIMAGLQELAGARITEVLPSLQNIFVEKYEPSGPFQENIGQFCTARELSNHPIAISVWDLE